MRDDVYPHRALNSPAVLLLINLRSHEDEDAGLPPSPSSLDEGEEDETPKSVENCLSQFEITGSRTKQQSS